MLQDLNSNEYWFFSCWQKQMAVELLKNSSRKSRWFPLIYKYDFLSGKIRASTTGFGIEFGPSIQAEVSPDEAISGSSRLGASMSLPPLFSRSWSNTNDVESMQDFFSKGKIHN